MNEYEELFEDHCCIKGISKVINTLVYDEKKIENFDTIEENIRKKVLVPKYFNKLLSKILLQFVRFNFSSNNSNSNKSNQMFVSVKPILRYMMHRLINLDYHTRRRILELTPLKLEDLRTFMGEKNNDNLIYDEIDEKNKRRYTMMCKGYNSIDYNPQNYASCTTELRTFYSYNHKTYENVPYLVMHHPIVYCNEFDNVYLLQLKNDKMIMIYRLPIYSESIPFNYVFNLLIKNNVWNIAENNHKFIKLNSFAIPVMNDITSGYRNIDKVMKNIDHYKDLFVNINNNYYDKLDFQAISYLRNKNNNNNIAQVVSNDDNNNIAINRPFFYLILKDNFNYDFMIESGGLFDYKPHNSKLQSYFYQL